MSILSSRKTLRMFFNLCWKNCEKSFMGGHDHFEGLRGCLVTNININFFVRNEVLNIFRTTIFSKKKPIFSNIITKNNSIFQEMRCRTTKVNITFSIWNGVPNTTLKFFPEKTPYRLNESQKPAVGTHIFPRISGSIGLIVSKKKKKK